MKVVLSFSRITLIISILIGLFSIIGIILLKNFPSYVANISHLIPSFMMIGSIGFTLLTILCAFFIGVYSIGFDRTLLLFIISCTVSFIMELSSTYNGFPFGNYKYTNLLGPKILNEVPYLIPPSWFSIVVVAYIISRKLLFDGIKLVFVSTLIAFVWDLSLDYAMTRVFAFWVWSDKGFFYGMPISNWGGWLFTLFLINLIFYLLNNHPKGVYTSLSFYLYITIVGFSALLSLIGGGTFAFVLSFFGIVIVFLIARIKNITIW